MRLTLPHLRAQEKPNIFAFHIGPSPKGAKQARFGGRALGQPLTRAIQDIADHRDDFFTIKLQAINQVFVADGSSRVLHVKPRQPQIVAAILRATVSGEPIYSEPSSTSAKNRALVVGGQPRSRPMRPNMS